MSIRHSGPEGVKDLILNDFFFHRAMHGFKLLEQSIHKRFLPRDKGKTFLFCFTEYRQVFKTNFHATLKENTMITFTICSVYNFLS